MPFWHAHALSKNVNFGLAEHKTGNLARFVRNRIGVKLRFEKT